MNKFSISCPFCGIGHLVSEIHAGKKMKCKSCTHLFRIPVQQSHVPFGVVQPPVVAASDSKSSLPSKSVAFVLWLFFGWLAIHKWYLLDHKSSDSQRDHDRVMACLYFVSFVMVFFTLGLWLPCHIGFWLGEGVVFFALKSREWA